MPEWTSVAWYGRPGRPGPLGHVVRPIHTGSCTCMARYLDEARQANIRARAAREAMGNSNRNFGKYAASVGMTGKWAAAVALAKGNPILAEAIRADIAAQADKETTAAELCTVLLETAI